MEKENLYFILIGMTLVTYLPRLLPLWLLSKREIPAAAKTWLHYIPAAILSALLLPSLLIQQDQVQATLRNPTLLAAIPTFFIAWRFKNTLLTIVMGMIFVGVLRWLLPVG